MVNLWLAVEKAHRANGLSVAQVSVQFLALVGTCEDTHHLIEEPLGIDTISERKGLSFQRVETATVVLGTIVFSISRMEVRLSAFLENVGRALHKLPPRVMSPVLPGTLITSWPGFWRCSTSSASYSAWASLHTTASWPSSALQLRYPTNLLI